MVVEKNELIVITGLSGAGKSSAIGFLEDAGYYCIDNMPPALLGTFLELIESRQGKKRVAVVIDARSTEDFNSVSEMLNTFEENYEVRVVYLDTKTNTALSRYKLTRRKHPYADRFNGDITAALEYEKEILSPLRIRADHIIDTSDITDSQLKNRLAEILFGNDREIMNIHVISFGFKHGIPNDADFVIDVRCLPNPYWLESLRKKTGLDEEVKKYIFSFEESNQLLEKLIDMLDFLNPLYIKEGKSQIVFAVGCTGGNHRSVAIAEALKEHFCKRWGNVSVNHRDINRN